MDNIQARLIFQNSTKCTYKIHIGCARTSRPRNQMYRYISALKNNILFGCWPDETYFSFNSNRVDISREIRKKTINKSEYHWIYVLNIFHAYNTSVSEYRTLTISLSAINIYIGHKTNILLLANFKFIFPK